MKVFEETFGIDKLLMCVSKIGKKIVLEDYDPINQKYAVGDADLQHMMKTLHEF